MPETLEAFFVFFIFSVPAYISIAVYKTRNPVRYYREKHSPVEQVALFFSLGIVVNIVTLLYIGLLWWAANCLQSFLPGHGALFPSILYSPIGSLFFCAFLLLIVYVVTSVAFSFVIGDSLGKLLPDETPLWVDELNKLKLRQTSADAQDAWVLAHLRNGDRFLGFAKEYRWIGDENNTMEITLEKAFFQLANSEKREKVGRVLLRSDDVLWLSPYFD
jgi:hypothetical protein